VATSGNGVMTGMEVTVAVVRRILLVQVLARPGCAVVVVGLATPGTAVPLFAAMTLRPGATATWASAS
jgi:hypothetical protein